MRYEEAPDLKKKAVEMALVLGMNHINLDRVGFFRGFGSSSRRTIARCHALDKLMQKAMKSDAFYAIEFLERFDKLNEKEKGKVILHELMHIPKTFGGGFRHHDFVCDDNVGTLYEKFEKLKMRKDSRIDSNGINNTREIRAIEERAGARANNNNIKEERGSRILRWLG
jgi:predicted metallopeptidase